MRISNLYLELLAAAVVFHAGPLAADHVLLSGGDARLTGSVRSINEAGILELETPLSPEPLLLKDGVVRKVDFASRGAAPEAQDALVGLVNGDLLPAMIEGLDERVLTVTSPEAGRMEIPRDALASLQMGVRNRKQIYAGPKSLEEWSAVDGALKNLTFERASLIANGSAAAAMKLDLPRDFILRFTLAWQARQMPNFQFFFADPLKPKGETCDRYYLTFNGAGLEIKREASKGARYKPIVLLNRTPNQYPDRELNIEIHVSRSTSRIQLFLNGEPEGKFPDPVAAVPEGSGIAVVCNASNGNPQEIRGIEVLELDDSSGRHRAEERGDPKIDSLISREDDRWGGRLKEIARSGDEMLFRFKSDFQNDPLEIPRQDVSTVFFAEAADAKKEMKEPPFTLRLRGGGSLRVLSCQFSEDIVTASHPLLGNLTLARDGVLALERGDQEPPAKPKP